MPTASRNEPDVVVQHDTLYSWYVLGMLVLAYAMSYVDRQIISLLVGPIKKSMSLTDVEFSLIQGSAFVLSYIVASPFFGRLVDVSNRRNILIFGVCAWSTFTVLGGFVNNYAELFISRIGVGFAEACVFPVGLSLIGDYFSPRKITRASSIFTLSSQLGSGLSLVFGGLVIAFATLLTLKIPFLATLQTWQMVLVVVGFPGFMVALALLTIREPRQANAAASKEVMPFSEVMKVFAARKGFYLRIYGTIGAMATVSLGQAAWYPAFLMRVHGLDAASIGLQFGASAVVLGVVGNLCGLPLGAWFQRKGYADAPLRAASLSAVGMFAGTITLPYWPTVTGAYVSGWLVLFFSSLPLGLLAGSTQIATPPGMRGIVASVYTFTAQVVGYMLAPIVMAFLTDRVFKDESMVGYSMQIVMTSASIFAGVMMYTARDRYVAILREEGHIE